MTHVDICAYSPTRWRAYHTMIRSLKIRSFYPHDEWRMCASGCSNIATLVKSLLDTQHFEMLQHVAVDFDEDWSGLDASRVELRKKGMDLEFTYVGCLRITNLPKSMEIHFEHPGLAEAWTYMSSLSAEGLGSLLQKSYHETMDVIKNALDASAFLEVMAVHCQLHVANGSTLAELTEMEIYSDVQLSWLEPESQSAETYELITDALIRYAQR